MFSSQLVVELSRLLVMEVDAVRAFANAVALVGPGPIRDELALIGREHQTHADALRGEITYRGYVPPVTSSHVEGIVLGGGRAPDPVGAEEALNAILRNEQLAATLYAKLLAKGPPEGARELLERLRGDAEGHAGRAARALARRAWDEPGAHP